jgi:hypothetical protein
MSVVTSSAATLDHPLPWMIEWQRPSNSLVPDGQCLPGEGFCGTPVCALYLVEEVHTRGFFTLGLGLVLGWKG